MRKMTENPETGKSTVRRIECLVGAALIVLWTFIHILRNSALCNLGIGRIESNCYTPFLLSRHFRRITRRGC
jgi:hypothetical protein